MKKPAHRSEMVNCRETYQFVPMSSTATYVSVHRAEGAEAATFYTGISRTRVSQR